MVQVSAVDNRESTPPYARYLAPLIRPFPNFDLFFIRSLRQEAVRLLQLKPGDRVLDAGCGPGGSFPYLLDAVGPSGEVIGVEISPEMVTSARKRIEKNRWRNVQTIESAAETAKLSGLFDGLLMLGAPDIYASPQALNNLLPHLSSHARIVAFGGKLSHRAFGKVLNPLFRSMFQKLSFASTPGLAYEPWSLLKNRVHELHIQEQFLGWMFLAYGTVDQVSKR
jgi:ubiquinone/menaquinone biosynthesis C-methylase UbiE